MSSRAEYRREWRAGRKERGLCLDCGKHAVTGKTLCYTCEERQKENSRKYREENTDRVRQMSKKYKKENPDKQRSYMLRYNYGITLQEKLAMFEKQGGKCAMPGCGKQWNGLGKDVHVDHCHRTNKIRGLLCSQCNTQLGMYEKAIYDDEWARPFDEYLLAHCSQ